MTNKQMISFPRELSDELGELIAEKASVCGGGAFEIWEAICERFGKPDPLWNPSPAQASLDALLILLAQSGVKVSGGVGDKPWSVDPGAQSLDKPEAYLAERLRGSLAGRKFVTTADEVYDSDLYRGPYPVYAKQPAPVAVVLPERKAQGVHRGHELDEYFKDGWNACLDEVTRLNP